MNAGLLPAVPLLAVDDLHVDFSTRNGIVKAVRGVSLTVAEGETLGVVGESGSGKSVTAFAVTRLLEASGRITGGHIRFRGQDITQASAKQLRSLHGAAVSMIFQNPRAALNPIRTVGLQLADAINAHEQVSAGEGRRRALELLKSVLIRDPEKRLDAYPHELSGGMCQRVMIAMAIAGKPSLLIADEPTTGLDVTTQKTVMDLVARIIAERGMSMILITHDLGLAACYCQRVMVMEQGKVVEEAVPRTLFSQPQHPYTKRLVAASPTATSTLADLAPFHDRPGVMAGPEPVIPARDAPMGRDGRFNGDHGTVGPPIPGTPPLLEVQNLVKRYERGVVAVDDVSFQIAAGESLGLVGESGSGKSTISRLVCRLIDASEGQILFDGQSIGDRPSRSFHASPVRKDIQIVFQDPTESLNPRYNAFACIAHPLRRLLNMKDGAALTARVRQCATRTGLPLDLLERFPHQLSGGQKARIGIARAIACRPRLLILDEPTAALDVSVQAIILQLLDSLRRQDGLSLLFVSHDLNVVRMMCERIVVLRLGKIVEIGANETIFRDARDPYTRELIDAVLNISDHRQG
jgi:peptide/nickel transport system ATP-binding protein